MTRRLVIGFIGTVLVMSIAVASTLANASTYVWKAETKSYRLYTQLVPAELVRKQPFLLDGDKRLHGLESDEMRGLTHVLVWVYRKPGNQRALDTTVIAEVDAASGETMEKPLEKMKLNGNVVFGNIFRVHRDEKHSLTLRIYNPKGDGYENAVFTHDAQ